MDFLAELPWQLLAISRHVEADSSGDNRIDPPRENGAATRALDRLLTIKKLSGPSVFRHFIFRRLEDPEDDILDFDPRSDFQFRIDESKRKSEIEELTELRVWKLISLHPKVKKLID
jgi:hypothetical protein